MRYEIDINNFFKESQTYYHYSTKSDQKVSDMQIKVLYHLRHLTVNQELCVQWIYEKKFCNISFEFSAQGFKPIVMALKNHLKNLWSGELSAI